MAIPIRPRISVTVVLVAASGGSARVRSVGSLLRNLSLHPHGRQPHISFFLIALNIEPSSSVNTSSWINNRPAAASSL